MGSLRITRPCKKNENASELEPPGIEPKEEQNSAERKAKDAAQQTGAVVEKGAEKTKDVLKEAADKAAPAIKEASEKAKEATEKAREATTQAVDKTRDLLKSLGSK